MRQGITGEPAGLTEKLQWERVKVVIDVTTLKMARKPVKLQQKSPAGCAGEGKQNKGNAIGTGLN